MRHSFAYMRLASSRRAAALAAGALALGASAAIAATERTSVGPGGAEANAVSAEPKISSDGRIVTFSSTATNLVAGDLNGAVSDVFVHDRTTNATELLTVNNIGGQANADSFAPALNADGRLVAFESQAGNLVQGDGNGDRDVFMRDRAAGTTERLSINSIGNGGNGASRSPSVDALGSEVAFASAATNLVLGDTNGQFDVFVRSRSAAVTQRVSVGPGGLEANGQSGNPSISDDGRYVAFASDATNLVAGDANNARDIFVHDRATGATQRVSLGEAGAEAQGPSGTPEISGDGRFVAFSSAASNLVDGDTNKRGDVFVHDRDRGVTELVSTGLEGEPAKGNSALPALGDDGRYVAFESGAANLVVEDTNKAIDIFVRDRTADTTERVSITTSGAQATGRSAGAAISADARFTAFQSFAANLVTADANAVGDIFVRERPPPVLGESVSVLPVEGEVLVSVPASARASANVPGLKGRSFVPLSRVRTIPVGSFFDTRKGKVSIKTAKDKVGTLQSGNFADGVFQVLQKRSGLTTLKLKGASFAGCRSATRGKASIVARAARRKLSKRAIRRLRGSAKGRYRTRGRHSSATVRGTVWVTSDRCDGTLTKVKRGKVAVRDFRRKRTIVVRKGKSYLARAR